MLFVILSGSWLYALKNGVAEEFQQFWDSFGVQTPEATRMLFDSLEFWWVTAIVFAAISFLPFLYKRAWPYLPMFTSAALFLSLVIIAYAPTFSVGRVI